jgi:hypothetical protein
MSSRQQIIVLGMHRSGTSAITGMLRAAGAYVGSDAELPFANEANPAGYFERRDIMAVCNNLLSAAGADWWRISGFDPSAISNAAREMHGARFGAVVQELASHGLHAIKDPRLCILFPVLEPWLRDPVVIFAFRNPLESARSLRRRNGFPTLAGLALWEAYNVAALNASNHLPRILVDYGRLTADPAGTLEGLADGLARVGITGLDLARGMRFIDSDLRRQKAESGDLADLALPRQQQLWEALSQGRVGEARRTISPLSLVALQEFEADEAARLQSLKSAAKGEYLRREMVSELKWRQEHIRQMRGSMSWRITAALRALCALPHDARCLLRCAWWSGRLRFRRAAREWRSWKTERMLRKSPLFDRYWYLATYSDIAECGIDPLLHFIRSGAAEGRRPNCCFDTEWYLSRHPELAAAGTNPLIHYIEHGEAAGLDPHPRFDTKAYLARNPDLPRRGIGPLEHYLQYGRFEAVADVSAPPEEGGAGVPARAEA